MDIELVRDSLNNLLRMYFNTCNEIYQELGISKLSRKQIEYLKIINDYEKVTFGKLAEKLGLSKPTVTEMINNYIQNGLAYREQCEKDKRVYFISLTKKGKQIATSNELESLRTAYKLIDLLSEEEVKEFVMMFSKKLEV